MRTISGKQRGIEPSQRQRRVGEEVRKILAPLLLQGEIRNEILKGVSITVSEVRMSIDLKHAFVFVIPLGGKNLDDVVKALTEAGPYIRSYIAKSLRLRSVPILHFEPDRSYDEAEKIHKILNSDRVLRDLSVDDSRLKQD